LQLRGSDDRGRRRPFDGRGQSIDVFYGLGDLTAEESGRGHGAQSFSNETIIRAAAPNLLQDVSRDCAAQNDYMPCATRMTHVFRAPRRRTTSATGARWL